MGLFFNKKPEPPPPVTEIGNETVFDGEIFSKKEIRVLGDARGSFKSETAVVVAPNGLLDGMVVSPLFTVGGNFKGTAKVSGTLSVEETGSFQGELSAGRLKIAKGAFIQGKIDK